jgi:hypothetical protein
MTVKLESFQYLPRGPEGWGSRPLYFGERFTAVQGPNGAGKTPIMKGILQGMGHEVDLPPEVLKRCEFAETTLTIDGRPVTLTRRLGEDFEITIQDGSEQRTIKNQSEYAEWFVALFGTEQRALTTKQNQLAELYATVLLPALWVDQDPARVNEFETLY